MRVVIALGGNALLRRGEPVSAECQEQNIIIAARAIADVADQHDVIVTHGNGPQVGLLALQAVALDRGAHWPLDILDAESEGMIGYLIERELAPRLPSRRFATLLTQVEVDPADPAFENPTKPIGPFYDEVAARRVEAERGWVMVRDGDKWRRVVPSPHPQRILEIATIRYLVSEGIIVICAGGGGIPVAVDRLGRVRGIEAVIDKDRTSALLATDIGADALLLLTDVSGIYRDFAKQGMAPMPSLASDEILGLGLDPGSIGPKAEAAAAFATATGGVAVIGALEDAMAMLAGTAGTRVLPEGLPSELPQ